MRCSLKHCETTLVDHGVVAPHRYHRTISNECWNNPGSLHCLQNTRFIGNCDFHLTDTFDCWLLQLATMHMEIAHPALSIIQLFSFLNVKHSFCLAFIMLSPHAPTHTFGFNCFTLCDQQLKTFLIIDVLSLWTIQSLLHSSSSSS